MARREWLRAAALLCVCRPSAAPPVLRQARALVRAGRLGAIAFCRVAHADLLPAAAFVLEDTRVIADVDPAAEGLAFLGRHATLLLNSHECRLYRRDA